MIQLSHLLVRCCYRFVPFPSFSILFHPFPIRTANSPSNIAASCPSHRRPAHCLRTCTLYQAWPLMPLMPLMPLQQKMIEKPKSFLQRIRTASGLPSRPLLEALRQQSHVTISPMNFLFMRFYLAFPLLEWSTACSGTAIRTTVQLQLSRLLCEHL